MELRHLRYFVMTAEEGNVSRASEKLLVSQPAVSRQIKDLEEELGMVLFERGSKGFRLTEAGETALVHAREILVRAEGLKRAMQMMARRETQHVLRVGYLPTALPGFLAKGMREFNQVVSDVSLQIFEMSPNEQEEALRKDEIDLGLIGDPEGRVRREFQVEEIRRTELAMLVSDGHRLAQRKSVVLAEFGDEPFVTLCERKFHGRAETMEALFEKARIRPEVVAEAGGLSELLGLVGAGGLVAVAPADLVQLPHSGVVFLPLRKPKKSLYFSAVWRREGEVKGLRELVEMMK